MSTENRNTPDPHGSAAPSGNDQANDVAVEDAERKEILNILQNEKKRKIGFGKVFWGSSPAVIIFGYIFDLNLSHKLLLVMGLPFAMLTVIGCGNLIYYAATKGFVSSGSFFVKMARLNNFLLELLLGFGTWGGVFIAFFNHHY